MAVYSYYYGAAPNQGIGVQAQSREVQNLPCQPTLNELASMHALSGAEQNSDMLCFLLESEQYTILGRSYTAPPKDTGYTRSAPCSMQYIIPTDEFKKQIENQCQIINDVDFQKPTSAAPAALDDFPRFENNYPGEYETDLFASLVDALVKSTLDKKFLLIVLPEKEKDNYRFARWTMAEAMQCLHICLSSRIHFFTGLPVSEGVSDPRTGLENAFRYGANVVFCTSNHFHQLQSYYGGAYLDMNKTNPAGKFAQLVAKNYDVSPIYEDVEEDLQRGRLTYEELNKIAEDYDAKWSRTRQQENSSNCGLCPSERGNNSSSSDLLEKVCDVLEKVLILLMTLLIIAAIGLAVYLVYVDELPDFISTIFSQTSATDAPIDDPAGIPDDANG